MSNKDFFENGCFSPEWTTETHEEAIKQADTAGKFKDKETLLQELRAIKQRMQEIREKEWRLAKLLEFHNHKLAKE